MTHPDDADAKARATGRVYVLKPFVQDRETVSFERTVATRLLLNLDKTYHFREPEVRAFIHEIHQGQDEVREWCNAAWRGQPPSRRTDTWERVFEVLHTRNTTGATGAEIQRITSLGHGAVSGVLCRWDEAGVAYRLIDTPSITTDRSNG